MTHRREAALILACERHSDAITNLLDRMNVRDWVLLPAAQARRLGFLQYQPAGADTGQRSDLRVRGTRVDPRGRSGRRLS